MKKNLLLVILLLSPCLLFSQNIAFSFQGTGTPVNNGIWKDTLLNIKVVAYAPGQVTTVTASVAGRQVSLTPGASSSFTGVLSLGGLEGDTLTLLVAAADALNNTGDTAITFIYRPLNDPGVSLIVNEAADSTVARPFFPLQAKSPGNKIDVYTGPIPEILLLSAVDSVPVVDLSGYNGRKIMMTAVATDAQGRTARKVFTVFVESSPYLSEYLTVDGKVLDFRYNKALVVANGTGYPVLVDAATGQSSAPLVNQEVGLYGGSAFVTADGALFKAGPLPQYIYWWKNGQVVVKTDSLSYDQRVAGNHAGWTLGSGGRDPSTNKVKHLNLVTGIIDTITLPELYTGPLDVAPNGTMVILHRSGISWYKDGQLTLVVPKQYTNDYLSGPVTDGYNMIYSKPPANDLYFYNGQNQTSALLGNTGLSSLIITPRVHYQLNNKYAAFVRGAQIHLRDTSGQQRQMTTFGTSCSSCVGTLRLDLLNEKGEMMVSRSDTGRIFITPGGQLKKIAFMPVGYNVEEVLSRSFYDNGNWYILIGKTIFKVNTGVLPDVRIASFEKTLHPDSILKFNRKDFDDHFFGPGNLMGVKLIDTPKHGKLKYQNTVVSPNFSIAGSQLIRLTYTPDQGYTGRDTIRWTADNGLANSIDTAYIFINVTTSAPEVPQPIIAGLSGNYCNAAGIQEIKILNQPSTGSGVQTEVLLDSTTALQVDVNGVFKFDPGQLTPGKHNISIRFYNDSVQRQEVFLFNVDAASTPSFDITVNVNPITTDTIPVVITAVNITGGGKLPLYTFAWDNRFSNQLKPEGIDATITVAPTKFKLGANVVYVRMKTSEQCYTEQAHIDSITINKTNITAIVDVDNPAKPVIIYPNPFRDQISVNGLQPTKTYIISLYDVQGKLLLHKRVVNQSKTEINPPAVSGSIYILRVYDEKAKRLMGAQKLIGY